MSTAPDGFTPDIVTLAVDYYRSPLKYRSLVLPPAELPEGAGKLLRVANGDGELLAELSRQARVTPSQFKAAAGFFIRQAFFARDADYYRMLGLQPTDDIERIKEHHRLLMKLFHPDRGDTEGDWTDALATRVNQAYSVLRRPESRREYDASLRAPQPAATATGGQRGAMKSSWVRAARRPEPDAMIDTLPPSMRRHFPEFVLGGIGVLAALVVGALYLFEEPPLTGSGAIGGPTKTAPITWANKRGAADTVDKSITAFLSSENTQEDASHGGQPGESVAALPGPATADPQSLATVAPVVIAANESPVATASNMQIAIPAPPEPVAAKTVAPKVSAKLPEAPARAPAPRRVPVADSGQTAQVIAPPPVPAKTAQVNAQTQPKVIPTINRTIDRAPVAPPATPPRSASVKPVTVAAARAPGVASEVKTSVPEKTPSGKVVSPPAPSPTPANSIARIATGKTSAPKTPPREEVIPPPTPVSARTTVETAMASAAPVAAIVPVVSRPIFPDLELERLLGRFIGSYEQGDLDRFMVLFHEDAKTGEKKDGKATTRKEYADLFTSTQLRQMTLQGLRWEKDEELARGQGRFLARVAGRGDPHIREYAGSIRVEVANVGGDLLIKGLFHSIEAKKHIPRGTEGSGAGAK